MNFSRLCKGIKPYYKIKSQPAFVKGICKVAGNGYISDDSKPKKVIHHEKIINTGKLVWTGRKLVYLRGNKDPPEANPSVIESPDIRPNPCIKQFQSDLELIRPEGKQTKGQR